VDDVAKTNNTLNSSVSLIRTPAVNPFQYVI